MGKLSTLIKGASELEQEFKAAKAAKQIASKPRMSRAEGEALGLYHPIAGGIKLEKPVSEYTFDVMNDPRFETATRRALTPEDLYGKVGIPLIGDRARAGKVLTGVEGRQLTNPVNLEGGSEFMMNHPEIWASDKGVVSKIAKQARLASETGKDVLGINVIGSPTNVDFNSMVSKVLADSIDPSALRKKDIKAFNAEMRKSFPDFVGVEHPELVNQLTAPKMGNMRTYFVDRMNQAKYQEVGFPDVAAARIAVTEPRLLDAPTGSAGFTVGKFDPERLMIENPEVQHETYPVHMGGEYVGGLEAPIDFRDVFTDFSEARRLMGADPSRDIRSFSLNSPAIQEFNQEWLDKVMPTYEQVMKSKRYAKGGKVNLEKEFKQALMAPIPANARMLAKSIMNPSKVDESSFTEEELNAERKAYLNSIARSHSKEADALRELHNSTGEFKPNIEDMPSWMIEKVTPTIQYSDYPSKEEYKNFGVGNAPIEASFNDKGYSMSTSVGRAKYIKDKDGNVHIIDTYDFPKGSEMRDYGLWSLPFKAAHAVGEKFSHKMPVDINLGQDFLKADSFAKGGSAIGKNIVSPTVTKTGEILGSKALNELYDEIKRANPRMPLDVISNMVSGILGIPGDVASTMTSTAKPVMGKNVASMIPTSEDIKGATTKVGLTTGAEYPLLETAALGVNPRSALKGAKALEGLPAGMSIKDVSKPVEFTSTLAKTVNAHKMESMPGQQWSAWINSNAPRGAKKEAEATGLHDWLKTQPKVTKYDIEEHIGENLPKVGVHHKDKPLKLTGDEQDELKSLTSKHYGTIYGKENAEPLTDEEMDRYITLANIDSMATPSNLRHQAERMEKSAQRMKDEGHSYTAYVEFNQAEHLKNRADHLEMNPMVYGGSKFEKWTLPGGSNYKETMLSLPSKHEPEYTYNVHGYSPKEGFKTREEAQAYADEQTQLAKDLREQAKTVDPSVQDAMNRAIDNMENFPHRVIEVETPISQAKSPDYRVTGGHSYDDPNTDINRLAHLRTKDRQTVDDRRALFLEELQSDWAQQGRDRGFRDESKKLTPEEEQKLYKYMDVGRRGLEGDALAEYDNLLTRKNASNSSIPSGPYVEDTKDWTALGLKHALKQAVEGGHDVMAWTTGAQQAERYNLSNQINELTAYPKGNGMYELSALDKDGFLQALGTHHEKDLPNVVGKELANKIVSGENLRQGDFPVQNFKGIDLQVGGEGMKGYYDQIVPNTMNDVLKQIGAKERVKPIDIQMEKGVVGEDHPDYGYPTTSTHLGIEITPELREKVLTEGLPHFHEGGQVERGYKHGGSVAEPFSDTALKDAKHDKLAVINPKDYADYANPIGHWGHNDKRKMAKAKDELKHGGIKKIPELMIKDGKVIDHNGRHRNITLAKKGVHETLVRLHGDVSGKTVKSENGKKTLPMPKLEDEFKLANIVGAKQKK